MSHEACRQRGGMCKKEKKRSLMLGPSDKPRKKVPADWNQDEGTV